MKYCPNCGAQIPVNANFCGSCGTRIGASQHQPQPQSNEQPKQKMFSMDNYRAIRAAQKQRMAKMKWWHWAIITIGVVMLTMMKLGA